MKYIAKSLEYSKDNFVVHKRDKTAWNEEELSKLSKEPNKKYLGLSKKYDYGNDKICVKPYYYIGYRWFDEKKEECIRISPKKSKDGKQADYLKMFLTCLKDPIVSKKMNDCYGIKFNEKWIEIEENEDEITPLIILQFLKVVHNISKKGLKKGYTKITENLTSKIKGKILVNQTIKQNHFKNRLDKTICNHQIFTIDCIENQILKTALFQCSRNLQNINNDDITKLLKFNLNSFELVNTKEIFKSDFSKIKYSPFYKDYKEALILAQMIFKRFGFTLNSSKKDEKIKIPPFYIDMPKLFERYVEVKLREVYPEILDGNTLDIDLKFKMRPDFLLASQNMIIDAKYKYWFYKNNINDDFKDDFQQLSLYGRESNIRQYINLGDSNREANILFIYPEKSAEEYVNNIYKNKVDGFNNIYKLGIKIPSKESER
ncbi:hypothetical protein JHD46_00500 [Sulfurimonas sp. SAG-AH-194-C20]|nr:hypothetical protein [Sulfurimonas sp. SAG-AH-194-C20]MDF1878111.1 hypothetical protein [Sulfurimonas sp. SAG-AH-194-C20]